MSSKKTATTTKTAAAAARKKEIVESEICASKRDRLFCYHVLSELEAIDAKGSEGPGDDEDHDLLYVIKMAYEIWKGRPLRLTPEAEAMEKADSASFDAHHMKGYDLLNDRGDMIGWSANNPTEGHFRPATPYDLWQEKMDAQIRESLSHF